jgi:nucleoid DNA-binding protein
MTKSEIIDGWARLGEWYRRHRPEWAPVPIAQDVVERLVGRYGAQVPADWLASLSVHDGDVDGLFGEYKLLRGVDIFPCDQNEDGFQGWPGWPVASAEAPAGGLYIVESGDVIESHRQDIRVVAPSFGAWLREWADRVEVGGLLWHPLRDRPIPVERLPDDSLSPHLLGDETTTALLSDLRGKGSATIRGAGRIVIKRRAARSGVNPATHARINIPAKAYLSFEPSEAFSAAVAGDVGAVTAEPGRSIAELLRAGRRVGWPGVGELGVREKLVRGDGKEFTVQIAPWFWISPQFSKRATETG